MHLRRAICTGMTHDPRCWGCLVWVTSRATGCVGLGQRPSSGDHSSRWAEGGKEAATAGSWEGRAGTEHGLNSETEAEQGSLAVSCSSVGGEAVTRHLFSFALGAAWGTGNPGNEQEWHFGPCHWCSELYMSSPGWLGG